MPQLALASIGEMDYRCRSWAGMGQLRLGAGEWVGEGGGVSEEVHLGRGWRPQGQPEQQGRRSEDSSQDIATRTATADAIFDYSIWQAVEQRLVDAMPDGTETKEDFLVRLRRCAVTLPKKHVAAAVKRMKANLKALVESKGFTPKND